MSSNMDWLTRARQKREEEKNKSNSTGSEGWLERARKDREIENTKNADPRTISNTLVTNVNNWLKNHSNYVSDYQKRYSGRKGNYEDAYLGDSASWLDKVSKQKSNFDAEADRILAYMDQYKGYLDAKWADDVRKTIAGARDQQKSIYDSAVSDNEWWSSFGSEDLVKQFGSAEEAYKYYQRGDGYNKKYEGKTLDELQTALDALPEGEEKDWLSSRKSTVEYDEFAKTDTAPIQKDIDEKKTVLKEVESVISNMGMGGQESDDYLEKQVRDIIGRYSGGKYFTVDELKAEISKQTQKLNTASRIQKGIELAGVADPTSKNYDPGFSQSAKYVDSGKTALIPDYKDVIYDAVNKNTEGMNVSVGQAWGRISDSEIDRLDAVKLMSDDEVALYNYYTKTHGYDAAEEYLDSIMDSLNARKGQEMFRPMENKWVAEELFGIAAGFDQANSGIRSLFSNEDYIPTSALQYASGYVREDLKDNGFKLPDWLGGGSLAQGAYDLITTTANMAPSMMVSAAVGALNPAAGAVAGNALMGASAAGNAYQSVLNMGYGKEEARVYSTAIGVSEVALGSLIGGISKLGGVGPALEKAVAGIDSGVLRFALQYGGKIASESLEEGLQEILDPVFKNLMLHADEDINWSEVAYSALLGGLSAGLIEGIDSATAPLIANQQANKQAAKDYGGSVDALIEEGLQSDANSQSYKLAQQYQKQVQGKNGKGGKALTGAQIRNLLAANQEQVTAKDMQMIQQAAEKRLAKLGQKTDVSKIAELATRYATGGKLTRAERSFLVNSEYGPQVTSEMLDPGQKYDNLLSKWENDMSGDAPVEFSRDWIENVGTRSVNRAAYDKTNFEAEVAAMLAEHMKKVGEGPNAYQSLESRMEGETDVAVSDTGKAVIQGTDQEVDLTDPKFKQTSDDGVVLDVNGADVRAEDIEYDSYDQGLAINAIGKIEHITPEAANALYAKLDMAKPLMGQLNGMDEAFTYGYYNYSEADLAAGNFAENLTKEQLNDAYKLGQYVAKNSTAARTDAIKNMRTAADAIAEKAAQGTDGFVGGYSGTTYNATQAGLLASVSTEGLQNAADLSGRQDITFNHIGINDQQTKQAWVDAGLAYVETDADGNKFYVVNDAMLLDERDRRHNATNAAKSKTSPKGKNLSITYNHGGGVIEDIGTAEKKLGRLNEQQRAGIELAKILHKMGIGTDFEFFTSKTIKDKDGNTQEVFLNDDGEMEGAYAGLYLAADGKIRINLNAYSGTKGLAVNAMSHELVHFIKTWSLEKYTAMAEFLTSTYGESGMTMHQRVLREQDRLKGIRGKDVGYGEAYDEVVANALNRMFDDGKMMEKLAELKQKDKGLVEKLWEGIKKFVSRFMRVYQNNQSLYRDTADLMQMKEAFEQLQNMFADALVEASENFQASLITKEAGLDIAPVEASTQYSYQSLAEAAGFEAVQNEDGTRSFVRDGQAVSEVTVEDIDNSPIGAFINFSVEMKDITADDAKRQKEMFAQICTMACKTNDFAMTMQFVGSAVFTGMKANADKQYGTTYDFPSICTKTQAVIDAMSAKMVSLGRGLKTDEIVKLYEDVFASGNPVPCPECYVFSRWIGIGGLLDNIKKYQDYYGDMAVEDVAAEYRKMRAEVAAFAEEQGISFGKAKGALTAKLTKEFNKLTEKIEKAQNQGEKVKPSDLKRLEELEPMMNTVKGMTWLENVYFADSSLKKVNPKFRVPNEVLFDLNNGEAFASQYKEAWAFRTTQGAGYGKAITPYAEARLGEGVLVTNNTSNAIKGKAQGTLNNYFLNQKGKLDKQSRDALLRARLKQKIQAFIGGQRFQSTSDARYENASDYLLAALEMQAMGGMVQAYTKVDGAIPAFSAWGFSSNQSLMPLDGGLDADGNVKDTAVGGMNPKVAFENRNKHESAGTITIGVNDNHIRAMFQQWVRDFIIPYHASGGKADVVAEFRRIQEGKEAKGKAVRSTDYSRTQSDKILSDDVLRWQGKTDAQIQRIHEIRNARIAILTGGKPNMTVVRSNRFLSALYDKLNGGEWDGVKLAKSKVESQIFPNEFWDQTVTYDESAKITKDYLEYCEDLGFLHRFSGTVPSNGRLVPVNGYDQNGTRVQLTDLAYKYDKNGNKTDEVEPFFWKVLTDRRMYDNSRNYLPQKVVTLNDTTADTVTGFAKNNQGRQYDKAKADALAKKIAGGQYSSQETDFDKEFDYSQLNWATDLGIISAKDRAIFERTINNEIYRGAKPQTANGEYIIDTGKCLMFTDGDFHSPTLTRVIVFATEYESLLDEAKRRILYEAGSTGDVQESQQVIEDLYGPGFAVEYTQAVYGTNARQVRGRKGSNRSGTDQKARAKSLKERFAEEGLSHLLEDDGEVYSSQQTDLDNAPTFYSQMGKVVEGMKQEKFGASSVISMLRGRGVKAEEIRWSGIQAFLDGKKSVTKADLLEFIKGGMLHIEEETRAKHSKTAEKSDAHTEFFSEWRRLVDNDLSATDMDTIVDDEFISDADEFLRDLVESEDISQDEMDHLMDLAQKAKIAGKSSKWDEYKLDGGENYRELVFKMPGSAYSNQAMQVHWGKDAQGILAHARMQDFEVDGKKMLFIEEIQSDWHNAGQKDGYTEGMDGSEVAKLRDRVEIARAAVAEAYTKYSRIDGEFSDLIINFHGKDDAAIEKWERDIEVAKERTEEARLAHEQARHEYVELSNELQKLAGKVPDAPFRNNYHEYVLKRLLRMAAEEGYDSIGWTTADIQSERWSDEYAEGYRIEYDQDIPKFLKKYGKQWDSTVGKTALDNGKEVWSMAITDAMKKSVLKEGQVLYSTQQTDNITNRDLLANAFEGITQNSNEYKLIQEYKGHIKELNKLESKLSELNAEIRKIRFGTTGARDTARLTQLEDEAKKVAKEINRYDKRLLSLEASEPLRKVIERERKKEAKKTMDHVIEIQQNKKLRAEQAELRHKIRKTVRDLDKILNRGNKKQNVKEDMKGFVSKALELADYLFTDHVSNDDLIRKGITVRMTPKEAALVKDTEDILSQLYDHADSLTDEEFTRLDAKRKANEDKLRDLLTAQRNERLNTPVYNLFNDLVTEYANLKNSNQEAIKAAYDPNVERFLRSYIGEANDETDTARKTLLQNMRVADMTKDELWKLLNAYKMVLHAVKSANQLFVQGKTESIEQMAGRIMGDFSKRKAPESTAATVLRNLSNKIGWDYEKLYYALDRIGSEAFTELVMNIANSENIVMQDVMEAAAFRDEMVKKYGFNNWDVNKKIDREFLDNTGKKFNLTLGQMMALYAYSRREGAWDHIEYGGFVFGERELTNPRPADSYKLTKEQCEAITDLLTKEQKSYVEDMQKFLSETMGEKGNEVSMTLYGIKMFTEKNYFPIHIAGQFKAQANESQAKAAAGFSSMSNAGFTHAQNPNAKAPFVLEGFNEIWVDHVNEMSRYHGTVPALEDMRRVMNRSSYSEAGEESMALKQMMENAYGKEAVDYFDNLYREANSGAITDKLQKTSKWLLSMFRKNSVAYSLSVLVQQPASLVRAYSLIDKKYFGFKGFGTITSGVAKAVSDKWTKAHTNAYNEMLKYAPGVTMAKEIGGFDTATGGSIRSYLLDTGKSLKQKWNTGTAAEKGKAVLDLVDDNAIANLPNLADKIAWIEIWNACKREAVAKHKDLAPNSEEFMQAVGERFTEVIRATQVYDSIFAKSPMLKSKNLAVQYLVSFMNEPNTVANMAESAVREATKGNWKGGLRTAGVLIHSIIFTNVMKSIIYAMRDDDEDETYIEKYIEAVAGNMMSDFNPLNYIPVARDVVSLAQGYDVERADMAVVSDAIDALTSVIKNATKETDGMTEEQIIAFDKKVTEANWRLVESIATFFGIPVKNIRREVMGVINHAKIAHANVGKTTAHSAWEKAIESAANSIPFVQTSKAKQDKLYEAIISGDKTYVSRLKAGYKDDAAYNSAVRKALRENDPRIHAAAQARYNGNIAECKRIYNEIKNEGNFSPSDILEAINSEESKIRNEEKPETMSSSYSSTDFVNAVIVGDTRLAATMKDDIISAKVANGKSQEEAEESFTTSVSTATRNAFDSSLLDEAGAKKMLREYADMDEEEADSKVRYWAMAKAYPQYRDDLSEARVEKYNEFAKPAGISLDVFVQYLRGTSGLETKYDKWGDVEESVRDQVLAVIDSLPITWEQKDALYLAAGYAESNIWDVPW